MKIMAWPLRIVDKKKPAIEMAGFVLNQQHELLNDFPFFSPVLRLLP
jgi:hypothetical protein